MLTALKGENDYVKARTDILIYICRKLLHLSTTITADITLML